MSTKLNSVAEEYTRRLAIRRRMLDHLGLTLSDAAATACYEDIRETVFSCAHCADPAMCENWLEQGHSGTPEFCTGRSAFLALRASIESVGTAAERSTGTYG